MGKIKKLKPLQKGSTIAFISPSSPSKDTSDLEKRIKEECEKRGYKAIFGPSFYASNGYLAGSDEVRAKDIMDFFLNPEIDAIICARGGYGLSRIIQDLDYEALSKHPKICSGYSDVTALINNLYTKANMISFHGMMGYSFSKKDELTKKSLDQFFSLLENKEKPFEAYQKDAISLQGGKAIGRIVGGNLTLLATLNGTPYDIDYKDNIILIEDVGEKPYAIDRYLSCLKLNHHLEEASGFIIGTFKGCDFEENNGQTVLDVIKDYLLPLSKPILYHFNTGHDLPFITLPIGAKIELDSTNKQIKLLEDIFE